MEDGAKENTALNIQKPLEILVTDEDKHGTDIACMSDFFGIYIEQLSAELSNQVMRGVVEKIPAADVQILGELVHGVDVLLSGKYGYIPDFDSLPNDVKDKLKKGIYTLGESRQVEDNVRAVVLDENGTRIKDVTLKRVLNTPDTLEMSRSITSQVQMRQIAAKLDEIAETQSYLIEMERNNNIIKPFLNARDLILRAQNAKTIDERKHYMIEASKELNDVINASRLDLKTSSEHLAKLTRFPILRNSSQIKNYMGYVAQDLQLTTKYVGVQMHVLDYLGDYETANEVLSSYQMMLSDFADRPINKKNQSTAILMQNNSTYSEQTQDYWLNFRSNIKETIKTGSLLQDTLLKTSKTISVHFNGKTMDKLLMVVKQKFDEKENKSFWHIELETLPYRNRESKGKYCITTFLHGMYYPDEDIFTHIDYTKNQYDIDTYLNKYSDCNEDMPIDTYTSSNELHYKIWCIEGGKYSRETWYRLMVVSLNQEYVELLDEILE